MGLDNLEKKLALRVGMVLLCGDACLNKAKLFVVIYNEHTL